MIKCPFWVQKLLHYTIQDKTAFSLHVVESASDDYNF